MNRINTHPPSSPPRSDPKKQITGIVGGQITTVCNTPAFTSADTPWSGYLLEGYTRHAIRENVWWGWHKTHACLVTRGTVSFRIRQFGRSEAYVAQEGSTFLFPRGFGETRFTYDDAKFQILCVEIDATQGALSSDSDNFSSPQLAIQDGHIASLIRNMESEVIEGCPSGALYAQALSMSLTSYLYGRFASSYNEHPRGQDLSQSDVDRLKEYIDVNIGSDLRVDDIALVVGMRPRTFLRKFSSTFGVSPYKYILAERISYAKSFLMAGMPINEITNKLGFASESHFGAAFKKNTGISPGRFKVDK